MKKQPESEKLKRFNDFFNRNIVFDEDLTIWNQTDYWATPLETIGRGRSRLRRFFHYQVRYSLLQAGVPVSKMRLIYVKARQGSSQRAHMVLAYYANPGRKPRGTRQPGPGDQAGVKLRRSGTRFPVSTTREYMPASPRQHATTSTGGTGKLSRWDDLMRRRTRVRVSNEDAHYTRFRRGLIHVHDRQLWLAIIISTLLALGGSPAHFNAGG
ncbi:MAG: transglutaminase-like cysteine peptidase [Betaproteobacteria bacterium]|uniref:Transglutaminase-like cysteine peptidase n=1 Tax=Candidatus Proximibacter danicus TaxID=2954365 RepID=A0A9D7PR48_9PROT|nr:transglutaminase-like cysteine peptidase [Candidatus Proximibacter danicus]